MDEKDLQRIQDEIMKEIDSEAKAEEAIKYNSEEIASALVLSNKVNAEIDGTPYLFAYQITQVAGKSGLLIIAANRNKYMLANGNYKPFIINSEIDEEYTLKDNLRAAIEGFLRHVTGRVRPEVLEEDSTYQIKKK